MKLFIILFLLPIFCRSQVFYDTTRFNKDSIQWNILRELRTSEINRNDYNDSSYRWLRDVDDTLRVLHNDKYEYFIITLIARKLKKAN